MSSTDLSPEEKYIHREYLRAAKPRSNYDKYDAGDDYFRLPRELENKLWEDIRKRTKEFERITDVIPAYIRDKKYPVDDQGKGEIGRQKQQLDKIVDLLAYFSRSYNVGIESGEIKTIIAELEKECELVDTQIKSAFDTEPFKSILAESKQTHESELENKYGVAYKLFGDMRDFRERNYTNISRLVENEVGHQNRRQQDEYRLENEKKLRLAINRVREFDMLGFDPTRTMQLLEDLDYGSISDFTFEMHPGLIAQLEWYEKRKTEIFGNVRDFYLTHPQELVGLEYQRLRFIFDQEVRRKNNYLLQKFADVCSTEQLRQFLESESQWPIPIDLSFELFSLEGVISDEKRTMAGEWAMQKMPDIRKNELEVNFMIYRLMVNYLDYLQKANPAMVKSYVSRLIEVLPGSVEFMIRHEDQMISYCNFLRGVFVDQLKPGDIGEEELLTLVSCLQKRDLRYSRINQAFEALLSKVKERHRLPEN